MITRPHWSNAMQTTRLFLIASLNFISAAVPVDKSIHKVSHHLHHGRGHHHHKHHGRHHKSPTHSVANGTSTKTPPGTVHESPARRLASGNTSKEAVKDRHQDVEKIIFQKMKKLEV